MTFSLSSTSCLRKLPFDDAEDVTFELIRIKDKANDDIAEEIMNPPANSSQKVAKKRSISTSTSTVSPPVPSKVKKKCSVERSNDEEKDSNPDSQFLEEIKKYTLLGK